MPLQALSGEVRAPGPPGAVVDAVLAHGSGERHFEIAESVARRAGWRPALDARASDAREQLGRRPAAAGGQVPTLAELEQEFAGAPVRAPLPHPAPQSTAHPMD